MTVRPLPAGLPPQTLRGLRDLIHSQPRDCEAEPDLFFGPDDETDAEHSARVDAAREICADCPVRLACMAYALRNREEFGVWAGLDADAGELAYLATTARLMRKNTRPAATREVAA
jgi:WhiB family redox-sensing transcriptional regulator